MKLYFFWDTFSLVCGVFVSNLNGEWKLDCQKIDFVALMPIQTFLFPLQLQAVHLPSPFKSENISYLFYCYEKLRII
jgi:hypothetical protein